MKSNLSTSKDGPLLYILNKKKKKYLHIAKILGMACGRLG